MEARHRVMAAFALHATTVGTLFSRLPEIQARQELSAAVFGLVLTALPLGVILGSLLTPVLIDRVGPRRVLLFGLPAAGALLLPAAMAPGPGTLGAAIALFGVAFATGNLAINVEADRIEAAGGRRILNRCHGVWAVGFLVSTILAPPLIRAGISPALHFLALAVAVALLASASLAQLPVSRPRDGAARARPFALPGRGVLLIGLYAAAGVVLEGVTRSWGVIYLRNVFGAADWAAALALPAVMGMQMTGRFIGDSIVGRFGDVAVARSLAAVATLGLAVVALAPSAAVALAGFVLIGLGISIVMPQCFAASARRGDVSAAEGMAGFAMLSSLVNFAAPPVFGFAVALLDLRLALALALPLGLLAILSAGQLGVRAAAMDSTAGRD